MSDLALIVAAALLSQNASDQATRLEIARLREENEKLARERFVNRQVKPRAESRKKVEVKAGASTAQSLHLQGVVKGSMWPREFLLAVRSAGEFTAWLVKVVEGDRTSFLAATPDTEGAYPVKRVNTLRAREDVMRAIHAYMGYDPNGNFGTQDLAARAMATRELDPTRTNGLSREEARNAMRSVAGFVAGVAIPLERTRVNLQAREAILIETIIDLEKAGKAREALIEKARLEALREDLASL